MNEAQISTAAHLRERAQYYRSLAEQAESDGIARQFTAMADEYEEDAGRIVDAFDVDDPASPQGPEIDPRWP